MSSKRTGALASAIVLLAVGGTACAHRTPEAETAVNVDSPPAESITTTTSAPVSTPLSTTNSTPTDSMNVSNELVKVCDLHFASAEQAPKFDFDRSELRAGDQSVLSEIAKCVTTGPLQGRGLALVGRADPRGEVEYNFVLGEHRASSVQQHLNQLGVNASQVTSTSRGKLDATGTDEASWQLDRRVDIDLR
jgi:peptidoglycan-associated lipoprotein